MSYDGGLALLLGAAAVLVAGAHLTDTHRFGGHRPGVRQSAVTALVLVAGTVTAFATVWSAASEPATLLVVPAAAVLAAAAAAIRPATDPIRPGATAASALLAGLGVAVHAVSRGWSAEHVGVAVLALGALRRRRQPSTGSLAAYGPGLSLLLVPSLLAALDDDDLTRPLLLGAAALAVLLIGARSRLRAPLMFGGAVLALDALNLAAPVAAALPRWVSLGTAGAVLLVLGATYEQRRRDLTRLRDSYSTLA